MSEEETRMSGRHRGAGTAADSATASNAAVRATRGGHLPTGTSARRRDRAAARSNGKGERTRETIVAAARTVFERVGYLDARVSDIVAEAGIAHGSFYTYFPSKREVFEEIVLEVGRQISAAVVAHRPEDVPSEYLANLGHSNRRYLEVYKRNARMMVLADQVATSDERLQEFRFQGRRRHVERVAETIRRLQESGRADPDIDAHTTAGLLVAMLANFAFWTSIAPDEYDDELSAHTATLIWARAIGLRDRPGTVSD